MYYIYGTEFRNNQCKAKFKAKISTPDDGSDFGCRIYAPYHGIGENGVEGEDDATFQANLGLSDKLMESIYDGWHKTQISVPDGGLFVDLTIGKGKINFSKLTSLVRQEINKYATKI